MKLDRKIIRARLKRDLVEAGDHCMVMETEVPGVPSVAMRQIANTLPFKCEVRKVNGFMCVRRTSLSPIKETMPGMPPQTREEKVLLSLRPWPNEEAWQEKEVVIQKAIQALR